MSNFDIANLALQVACGASNVLVYDDKNMPSVMVKVPKFTWAQIGIGTSTDVFPAFVINGQVVNTLCFSKYMAIKQNDRAYSIPGQNYASTIKYDDAILACTNKGAGWHLQTRLEWMALALWSLRNGTLPKGNNNYGKDATETVYKALAATYTSEGIVSHVRGGTGPLSWSHNCQQDGVWDMNGNGYEFTGGVRLYSGELQVISKDGLTLGNDGADPNNSQASNSSLWYAIDGTDGTLITPNGSGTTTNSLKIDKVSGSPKWITGTISTSGSFGANLEQVGYDDSTICDTAKYILEALGLYKPEGISAGALSGDSFYVENTGEKVFRVSGGASSGSNAGAFFVDITATRVSTNANCGFRASYV